MENSLIGTITTNTAERSSSVTQFSWGEAEQTASGELSLKVLMPSIMQNLNEWII